MTPTSVVTLHLATSLDGYIASKDNSTDWFETTDHYPQGAAEEDPGTFLRQVDCFVMGSKTYELALQLGWPYGEVRVVVLTHRHLPAHRSFVQFYSGDLQALFENQLKPQYQHIWVVGGATVAAEMLRLQLADDLRLSILPVLLGEGLHLLDHPGMERALHLREVKAYKTGIVDLEYDLKQE